MTGIPLVLLLLGGLGLPLGVPPAAENPAMQHVAPTECAFYATWSATAAPDPKSANHTEQLLAEPEVQAFARSLEQSIGKLLKQVSETNGDPKAQQAAKLAPLWAKAITTHAAAAFATKIEMGENTLVFEGGLLVDAGADSAALADGLVQLLSSEELRAEPVTIGRIKCQRFAPQPGGPVPAEITIAAAGQYVLVGIGEGAVEGMVERLRTKQIPAWLTTLQKRMPVERRASMSYINTKQLVDTFLPLAGPQVAEIVDTLGLKQIGAIESVSGLDDTGMINKSFMQIEGRPRGLLTLLDGKGIKPENVSFIPKDATIAAAFSINTERVYNTAVQLIGEHVPNGAEGLEQAEAMAEQQLGIRIAEILPAFGDVWTVWMSPADGWLGATATVEVRDRAKLVALQTRIAAMLSDVPPEQGAPRIETVKFAKHDLHMLAVRGFPIRPSWTLTEDRLLFSFAPQSIKASLSAREEEIGLFADKRFASAFEGEGETISIGYQDTAKLFETTYSYITLMVPFMMEAMNEQNRRTGQPDFEIPFDMSMIPSSRSIHRHLKPGITITRRTADGLSTESYQTFPTPTIGTAAPVGVALLLPAVQAAREAAMRMKSSNNLKQIGLAMHNHAAAFDTFPPAHSRSKDGKPLLSWRVHILPFIEQQALYEEFHLDEPWDSEHNKKLIARIPEVYRSPKSKAAPGKTTYLGVAGPKGIFPAPTKESDGRAGGIGFGDITDGTSNTAIVVEANDDLAVEWTKPADFIPDEKDPTKGLLGVWGGGFFTAMADGSVQFRSEKVDPVMLMRLFERNDGQIIDFEALEGRGRPDLDVPQDVAPPRFDKKR